MIYIYSLGVANGLCLAALLFFSKKQISATRVMAFWCLLLALNFLGNFIYSEKTLNAFSFLIGWTYYLPAAYGGLLYLYCQKLLNHRPLCIGDSAHLLPLLFCYALNIDILLAPSELKLRYILSLPPLTPSFYVSQFILYAQAFIYGLLSIHLLLRYRQQYREQFSTVQKEVSQWMACLISLSLLIWLTKLSSSLFSGLHWLSSLGSFLIVLFIYAVGFIQWLKPDLLMLRQLIDLSQSHHDLVQNDTSKETVLHQTTANVDPFNQKKQERLALDGETHAAFGKIICDTVKARALYLQQDLSLAELATHTNISIHHLSETLNHHFQKNFYRFINEYRIEHFCRQLEIKPKATISELAMDSGFANKSTFNAAFKELKKLTPSQYREQVSKNRSSHTSKLL